MLSNGSDVGIRAVEPKLYSIQQQDRESPIYRTVKYISPSLGKVIAFCEGTSRLSAANRTLCLTYGFGCALLNAIKED